MDKSQLRLLARRHANGELAFAEYRRQRDQLIDDIVDGRVPIERVRTPTQPPQVASPSASTRPPSAPSPHRIVLGLLVLALVLWLAWPSKPEAPVPGLAEPAAPSTARDAPGPGERIVEELLRAKDWGGVSLGQFEVAWHALTDTERDEARRADSMRNLSRALTREMHARQAIYDLNASADNRRALSDLHAFGTLLGTQEPLPEPTFVELLPQQGVAQADVSQATAGAAEQAAKPSQAPDAIESPHTAPSIGEDGDSVSNHDTAAVGHSVATLIDNASGVADQSDTLVQPRWKGLEDSSGYTVQLFALSDADNVQKVLDTYPQLDLRVITYASGVRHRIVYGAFRAESDAAAAYAKLPQTLTRNQPRPVIRSIETLRATLQRG